MNLIGATSGFWRDFMSETVRSAALLLPLAGLPLAVYKVVCT
jgi:hypothetical protein